MLIPNDSFYSRSINKCIPKSHYNLQIYALNAASSSPISAASILHCANVALPPAAQVCAFGSSFNRRMRCSSVPMYRIAPNVSCAAWLEEIDRGALTGESSDAISPGCEDGRPPGERIVPTAVLRETFLGKIKKEDCPGMIRRPAGCKVISATRLRFVRAGYRIVRRGYMQLR